MIDSEILELNRRANRCFGIEPATREEKWRETPIRPRGREAWWGVHSPTPAHILTRDEVKAPVRVTVRTYTQKATVDPARVAFEVLAGSDEARRREYLRRQVQHAVAEALEENVARASQARQRADTMVKNLVARLREKTRNVELPAPEEAWKLVDFSTFDEDPE